MVDFEKCFKTRIYLKRSVPIQPKNEQNVADILTKSDNFESSSIMHVQPQSSIAGLLCAGPRGAWISVRRRRSPFIYLHRKHKIPELIVS